MQVKEQILSFAQKPKVFSKNLYGGGKEICCFLFNKIPIGHFLNEGVEGIKCEK